MAEFTRQLLLIDLNDQPVIDAPLRDRFCSYGEIDSELEQQICTTRTDLGPNKTCPFRTGEEAKWGIDKIRACGIFETVLPVQYIAKPTL